MDLARAKFLFLISGTIAVVMSAFLIVKKVILNPILLGTNIGLVLGAVSFSIPVPLLADIIGSLQAVGLYVCVFVVGIGFLFNKNIGFIGMVHPDFKVIRRLSITMLVFTGMVLVWSYIFVDNIRLGGGLPFILLNVTRRILISRYRVTPNSTYSSEAVN
ncbi:MAG: hypothetical protein N2053_07100 [Chitinispirillaceae bacterium]|nr:hypothetical protein [Chitinispirillaceae bacterium]